MENLYEKLLFLLVSLDWCMVQFFYFLCTYSIKLFFHILELEWTDIGQIWQFIWLPFVRSSAVHSLTAIFYIYAVNTFKYCLLWLTQKSFKVDCPILARWKDLVQVLCNFGILDIPRVLTVCTLPYSTIVLQGFVGLIGCITSIYCIVSWYKVNTIHSEVQYRWICNRTVQCMTRPDYHSLYRCYYALVQYCTNFLHPGLFSFIFYFFIYFCFFVKHFEPLWGKVLQCMVGSFLNPPVWVW